MKLLRACDCYSVHCEHNPPDGYYAMRIDGKVEFIPDDHRPIKFEGKIGVVPDSVPKEYDELREIDGEVQLIKSNPSIWEKIKRQFGKVEYWEGAL